jgi:hypothetical protein
MNVTKAMDTRIGELNFESGYPSQKTAPKGRNGGIKK